jgi:hypothetical protein
MFSSVAKKDIAVNFMETACQFFTAKGNPPHALPMNLGFRDSLAL